MSDSISRNMLSVYITSLIPSGLTYVFWMLAANYTRPEVIGIVVAIGSFSMVLGALSGFDVGIGMKRFLGKAVVNGDWATFKQIVSASTLFTICTSIAVLLIALNPIFNILEGMGINKQFVPVVIVIVIGNGLMNILVNALISALKSKLLVIPYLVSSLGRFPILFLLFSLVEVSELSIAWAYSSHYATLSVVLLAITVYVLRKTPGHFLHNMVHNIRLVVHGSLAKWIPTLIGVLETQLSVLSIFTLRGALETGLFYISYAIFAVISMIPSSINAVSHPVLSGMELDKQGEFLRRTLKIGFLSTMPITAIAYFYSESILSAFGHEFSVSADILSILLISLPMAIIMDGCYYLIFARGDYKNLLYLGLTVNITRIVSYFILVPIYGGVGGAISYVIGSIIQLILTLTLVQKIKLRLEYKMFFLIGIIPFVLGYMFESIKIGILGSVLLIVFPLIIYSKMKLINEDDIESVLRTVMPQAKAATTKNLLVRELKRFHLM